MGNLLVTPFYVKPVDVVAYSVAGIVALGSVQSWFEWQTPERIVFTLGWVFLCRHVVVSDWNNSHEGRDF